VFFSLKNGKNRQTLGALLPDPLASGGWGRRSQPPHQSSSHLTLWTLLSASDHKAETLSESIKVPYFLVISIAGVAPGFGVEELCCISYATDYENRITRRAPNVWRRAKFA